MSHSKVFSHILSHMFSNLEVDINSREPLNLTTQWGYCPEHLVLRPEDCAENYDKVEDNCIRISPYPLTWPQAEEKCVEEGGHLLHILSQEVQDGVQTLIKSKLRNKDFLYKLQSLWCFE